MKHSISLFLLALLISTAISCNVNSEMKNNNLYPVSDISIKYQLDWQKKFYNEKIIEFKNNPIGHGKIVFLGNSITQGLRHHIHEFYREDIVNRGISGDYTDGVLARLQEIKYYKPKAVFLLVGLNDFFDNNSDRPERTPQYVAKNIFLISNKIQEKSPKTKVFIQTIIPINNQQYLKDKPNVDFLFPYYEPSINEQINEVNKILKSNLSLNIIDLHPFFLNENLQLNPKFSTDGVHLSDLGYKNWINIVNPILKEIK